MTYTTIYRIAGRDYESIEEVGEWDYSWFIGAYLKDVETDETYFVTNSGCSCYGFEDGLVKGDLIPVHSWQEAVELAKSDFSDSDVASFAERLQKRAVA